MVVVVVVCQVLRVQGMPTDRVMYGAALTACGQKGAWKEAMGLIRWVGREGPLVVVIGHTTMASFSQGATSIGGEGRLGRLQGPCLTESSLSFARLCRCGVGLCRDMEDRGLKPNRVCYTSAITACQRGGEWRKALNIFLKMNSQGPAPDVAVGPDRQTDRHRYHHYRCLGGC